MKLTLENTENLYLQNCNNTNKWIPTFSIWNTKFNALPRIRFLQSKIQFHKTTHNRQRLYSTWQIQPPKSENDETSVLILHKSEDETKYTGSISNRRIYTQLEEHKYRISKLTVKTRFPDIQAHWRKLKKRENIKFVHVKKFASAQHDHTNN